MTYVIGINQFNTNAIICDTHVSWWRFNHKVRGENVGLKSGLFFPGCIYGISGSIDDARNFIIRCKSYLTGHYTLPGFWEKFLEFVNLYKFSKNTDDYFELLLSSRNLGKPQFYLLSGSSLNKLTDNLVTLGSGKHILDKHIKNMVSARSNAINELITQTKLPFFTFPYFYCLWLNEMAQGMDLPTLEKYYVGGIFHFLWQDSKNENAQLPAVYVMSAADPNKRTIYSWVYRVTYAEGALVFDNPIKKKREIIADTAARPNIGFTAPTELLRKIGSIADTQPFYYFCGFGFSDPQNRGEFGIAVTTKNEFVIDKNGRIDPKWSALIQDKFSRDYKLEIGTP